MARSWKNVKVNLPCKCFSKVVNEELEERIPRLPKYISDGLDWIEKKLGGR